MPFREMDESEQLLGFFEADVAKPQQVFEAIVTLAVPNPRARIYAAASGPSLRALAIDVAPIQQQASQAVAYPSSRYFASTKPGLLLLRSGGCDLRSGATSRSVAAPVLIILAFGPPAEVRFGADAAGFLVTAEEHILRALSSREPAFEFLFSEPRDLSLEGLDSTVEELESGIFGLVRELQSSATTRVCATEAHLQLLLTSASRCLEKTFSATLRDLKSAPKRTARLVDGFLQLVSTHYCQHWRLRDYARALNVSSGHLRASCARVTGASPVQLIHECTIGEAKRRLACTALSVSAIALDLGFDDPAYFSRLFRAKCGVSPIQYRRSLA
jgi:AraC family transcriptional activator of pobA